MRRVGGQYQARKGRDLHAERGALKSYPYGFGSRFEGVAGTNPEELIAAAHAGCFTTALSLALGEAGFSAEQMDTHATVALEKAAEGFSITSSHLVLRAKIPNIDSATFQAIAAKAKADVPCRRC